MIRPIFCFKISEDVDIDLENKPCYLQFEIQNLHMLNESVYTESHKKIQLLLAEKLKIDKKFIQLITIDEYQKD